MEKVDIDPVRGPRVYEVDGTLGYMQYMESGTSWSELPSYEQKMLAYKAASWNKRAVARAKEAAAQAENDAWEKAADESPEARCRMRCEWEMQRGVFPWTSIGLDAVSAGHDKVAPGMLYGFEFPWSEELLVQFGPEWLTKAFHTCGSISKQNIVTKITINDFKITAGNNSGKFLFEVEYAYPSPDLHTKLFAKCPFAMTPATQSDRFSSSVYKQPMDLYEINAYRVLEASFPMKTPKYYYGDISNETSNFILITERVLFMELDGPGKRTLMPYEIEGPYDKCKDFQLCGRDKEYYSLMLQVSAQIAAGHKTGKFGSDDLLRGTIGIPATDVTPEAWGCNPWASTGLPPADLERKLEAAYKFVSETACVLYPEYVTEKRFHHKFMDTMMKRAAYHAEIDYWKHSHPDYVALGHVNLNVDNAYFWRDAGGKLDCGVYDWGGFGSSCLGHKIYWMFNCSDFEQFSANLSEYLDVFIQTYRENGGPAIDKKVLEMHVLLTCLENMQFMVLAVPNCFKMCPAKEWSTIEDRHDPRIADNIDGKSTLRTTLHCLNNGIRILEEMRADEILQRWIQDVYIGEWGTEPKTEAVIFGRAD